MKIVTLEDNIVPATPSMPTIGGGGALSTYQQGQLTQATPNPQSRLRILALTPTSNGDCRCGSCDRCHQRSQWGGEPPVFNITVSPTITANGGEATQGDMTNTQGDQSQGSMTQGDVSAHSEGAYAEGARSEGAQAYGGNGTSSATNEGRTAPYPSSLPQVARPQEPTLAPAQQPLVIEKPVFIDRVHEVVNEVVKPMYIPIRDVVERIKREPMFMPFKTQTPVDRNVTMPVKVEEPIDRNVPIPVKVETPVERIVPVPVKPTATTAKGAEAQPFQIVTNKKDATTGINYFS